MTPIYNLFKIQKTVCYGERLVFAVIVRHTPAIARKNGTTNTGAGVHFSPAVKK
jgi:hypothetical protein